MCSLVNKLFIESTQIQNGQNNTRRFYIDRSIIKNIHLVIEQKMTINDAEDYVLPEIALLLKRIILEMGV